MTPFRPGEIQPLMQPMAIQGGIPGMPGLQLGLPAGAVVMAPETTPGPFAPNAVLAPVASRLTDGERSPFSPAPSLAQPLGPITFAQAWQVLSPEFGAIPGVPSGSSRSTRAGASQVQSQQRLYQSGRGQWLNVSEANSWLVRYSRLFQQNARNGPVGGPVAQADRAGQYGWSRYADDHWFVRMVRGVLGQELAGATSGEVRIVMPGQHGTTREVVWHWEEKPPGVKRVWTDDPRVLETTVDAGRGNVRDVTVYGTAIVFIADRRHCRDLVWVQEIEEEYHFFRNGEHTGGFVLRRALDQGRETYGNQAEVDGAQAMEDMPGIQVPQWIADLPPGDERNAALSRFFENLKNLIRDKAAKAGAESDEGSKALNELVVQSKISQG